MQPRLSEAVLDLLPLPLIVLRDGRPVYRNAEAARCQSEDPSFFDAVMRDSGEGLRHGHARGRPYTVVRGADAATGTVLLAVPVPEPSPVRTGGEPASSDEVTLAEFFHDIIRNSFDGIFVADGEGRTQLVNAGCERNYDLSAGDMVGRMVSEFESGGLIRPVIAPEIIRTGRQVTAVQRTHKGKTIMVTGIPLFDDAGKVRRVIINSRDITELTRLRAELEQVKQNLADAESEVARLRGAPTRPDGVIFHSEPMRRVAGLALRVARIDTTVLITGETGVGKEVLARFIHEQSPRVKAPFIKINCGAIPRELLEAELFGYESGAFTGAHRLGKPGLIETAQRGTLFLDEIGELPLDMQVKLLHVLEDRTVSRVGGTKVLAVDLRVVSATNRDLEAMVAAKTFRADLFYRLNVVPIEIPPISERRDDILPLVEQSLAQFNARYGMRRRLSDPVLRHLAERDWPGNVRELRNMVERLVVTARGDVIEPIDLPSHARPRPGRTAGPDQGFESRLLDFSNGLVTEAMQRFGSTRAAARHLGISQSSVVRKLKEASRAGVPAPVSGESGWTQP